MNKLDRLALLGYPTGQMAGVTGLPREVMVDTTRRTLRVHDGETPGGVETARADLANVGDGSPLPVLPIGATKARPVAQKLGERLSVNDITGVVADGVADDRPALALFFATTVRKGGTLTVPWDAKLYLGSSVTVPKNWTLEGLGGNQGVTDNATESYYDRGTQVKLGPGATLRHGGNGGLVDLLVIRAGLVQPVPDVATAALLVSQFAGTGIECAGEDVTVRGCLILGHAVGIDSKGWARTKVLDCGVDCHAGINISGGWDINRAERCHVWPYMTATTPGVHAGSESSHAPLRRNATGIDFNPDSGGNCDWSTAIDCFVYGHPIAFSQRSVSNVSFVRCQADYGSPNTGSQRGFSITGTTTYASLINCTGIAQATCVHVDTTGGASADNGVRIIGGIWAASGTNINIVNGAAVVHGNQFYSGSQGVVFGAGAEPGSIIGNYFQGVADPLVIDGTVIGKTEILGNSYDGVTEATENRLNAGLSLAAWGAALTVTDTRGLSQDIGGAVVLSGAFSGGTYGPYARVRAGLMSGTTGNEAAELVFATRRNATLLDRWKIHHDGHLQPVVDNASDIGGGALRARNIYGASGVVNTSDRKAKQDFAPIDDALLDAWGGVSWCLYRFRDAVAEKGEAARIHAGAIAQDVHDVLAAQGLNPWRYGLLCRDDLTEPTGDTDGSVRVTGERWGLRYDQCLVVEAAYQRRRADRSDSRITALEQRVFA
ncbi:endosialidase-like protein [Azospirillum baldaniorum]|uniref:tail fiber domain-containing protein n=1 Tax=Azospirillum baldaniorum TaxID=1064539 RepID=UPI0011AD2CCE|nr:tail fiber domain-containing protein [Azospirillum baldaniorum]TWA69744.1 endosialidase-like protein [Azospirillum baldaniorum]